MKLLLIRTTPLARPRCVLRSKIDFEVSELGRLRVIGDVGRYGMGWRWNQDRCGDQRREPTANDCRPSGSQCFDFRHLPGRPAVAAARRSSRRDSPPGFASVSRPMGASSTTKRLRSWRDSPMLMPLPAHRSLLVSKFGIARYGCAGLAMIFPKLSMMISNFLPSLTARAVVTSAPEFTVTSV